MRSALWGGSEGGTGGCIEGGRAEEGRKGGRVGWGIISMTVGTISSLFFEVTRGQWPYILRSTRAIKDLISNYSGFRGLGGPTNDLGGNLTSDLKSATLFIL